MTYSGWGRTLTADGELARPERRTAVTAQGPAIGNRRSYGDAALNDNGRATDMTRLDRIIGFDGDIVHVEAGCTIATLARIFAPKGYLPAVMPGTGFATVGGAIGMDVHGKNHHNDGSFGQHVTEITLLGIDGTRAITPADEVIWKATIGGLGQTGVILSAKAAVEAYHRRPIARYRTARAKLGPAHRNAGREYGDLLCGLD
ncbi:FAD-binding protein [Marivivens sp. JLT3646]|uniref:FAD-binding protein n=1 Tax=Marivivens sp. JLT3646 TaxID=1920883 RepID=UPI000A82B3B6|nr:FAD-binding protein [Marivivens sp. JLT3646]